MLRRFALSVFIAAMAVVALHSSPAQAEEVTLKWKLQKGAVFEIASEATTKTVNTTADQVGNNRTEETTDTEKVSRNLEVVEVTEDGNYRLLLTVNSIAQDSTSAERTFSFVARKDDNGKKLINVSMKAANPLLRGDDLKELMEKLASNMLDYKLTIVVTPRGEVVSAKGEGDPFADLPAKTAVTRSIARTYRQMFSPNDLPQMVAAEAFSQFPDKPVDLTADWPLRRTFTVMGLTIDGTGTTTLTKIDDTPAGTIVTLSEKLNYKVDTDQHVKMVKDLLEETGRDAGLKIQLTNVSLKVNREVTADATTLFNVEGGHTVSTTWSGLTIPCVGSMTINLAGQQNTVKMDLQVTVSRKNTWTKK